MSSLLSSVHVRYVSAGLAEIWIAAMTSSVDSAPYLVQRAEEISLGRRVSDALKAKGVTTLAQLAFCVGQPGQVLVQAEFETWSESLLTGMTVGEKASLRRLILEAQTMLVASLKDMAAPSEGASPKRRLELQNEMLAWISFVLSLRECRSRDSWNRVMRFLTWLFNSGRLVV